MVDLDAFAEECKAALKADNTTKIVEDLVKQAIADPEGLEKAFAQRKTGNSLVDSIVFNDDDLTIISIDTPPGLQSPAHNHNMWAVIGVYDGEENNRFFQDADGDLRQTGERNLKIGDVAVLNPKAIHAINNPAKKVTKAIHVYGGNILNRPGRSIWNPDTLQREDYNIPNLTEYTAQLSRLAQ